jgi:hypothetical protein
MQPMTPGDMIMSIAPLFVLTSIPFAIGVAYLAPKMGRNPWLWGILMVIPFINIIPMYIFAFMVAGAILDRLNAIADRAKNVAPYT